MGGVINLREKLRLIEQHWSPANIAKLNDYVLRLVKLQGQFVWHAHADTDELFLVLAGEMEIELRDGVVCLREGEVYVVPRGVEHRPRARAECHALLIEPQGTVNTGNAGGAMTAEETWI